MSTRKLIRKFKKNNPHLFYETEKVLVSDLLTDYEPPEGQEYAIITHTDQGMKICNFCSKSYKLVTNEELIIPMLEALYEEYPDLDVVASSQRDSRFYVDVIFDQYVGSIGKKRKKIVDEIFPKFRLVNSYDGKVRYKREFGFYRLICENGLSVPEGNQIMESGLHTDKLEDLINKELLIETTNDFIENMEDHSSSYKKMISKKVDDLEGLIYETIDATKFPKRQADQVAQRVMGEMKQLKSDANAWLLYNGFNGELNHSEEFKMTISRRQEVDRQVLDFLINY